MEWAGSGQGGEWSPLTKANGKTTPCLGPSDTEPGTALPWPLLCLSFLIHQGRLGWERKCQQVVTFAKIQCVLSTGARSEARPPGLTLEISIRGKPPAAARGIEARYKEGLLRYISEAFGLGSVSPNFLIPNSSIYILGLL